AARRHGGAGRRAHLLPRAGARSHRRAPAAVLELTGGDMSAKAQSRPLFDAPIVRRALVDSLRKLDPRHMIRNPVMFVVEVGSAFTTLLGFHALATGAGEAPAGFILAISAWLWLTVVFANFAEAMAEGRGKAQADALRKARHEVVAKRLREARRDA